MKIINSLLIITLLSLSLSAKELEIPGTLPVGDAGVGKGLVAQCAACHGASGVSSNSDWPNLAGQGEQYLFSQLKYFQTGERENVLMMAVIPYLKTLTDSQLQDIAAFYSAQSASVGQAKDNQELLARGEWLYRAGDLREYQLALHVMDWLGMVLIKLDFLLYLANKSTIYRLRLKIIAQMQEMRVIMLL